MLRGPQLMDGYYNKPDETALDDPRNGWLYTGDIATVDADGYFAIVDRKKEMIIVSGFNVYPREVEEALATHPAVLDSAAIGVAASDQGRRGEGLRRPKAGSAGDRGGHHRPLPHSARAVQGPQGHRVP